MFIPGSWKDCVDCPAGKSEATPEVCEAPEVCEDSPTITIDGEVLEVDDVTVWGAHAQVNCEGRAYIVFADADDAGQAAREYWADMAANEPAEFRCIVGDDALIQWAMGQYAGPGSTQVSSLTEWLDLALDCPEEHFASYDGEACEVDAVSSDIADEIGFTPTVAYRCE